MGKFAGFLKRAKRLAGIGSGIVWTINNLYKSVKLAVDTVVGLLLGSPERRESIRVLQALHGQHV
jgi:hypothetical protein